MTHERHNYNYLKTDLRSLFAKVYSNKEGLLVHCLRRY